jgi:nicotinamidase-related amidase
VSTLSLNSASDALVLIDLQRGIVARPGAPRPGTEVVEQSVRLAKAFRQKGATVVLVHVDLGQLFAVPVDRPNWDPKAPPPRVEASELVPEIGPEPGDIVITKRQWGAFYGTPLDQHLRRRGIRRIILGGIATNFGVESTARAANERGYELVLVEDAMTSVSAEGHEFSIKHILPRLGLVRSTAEVLAAFGA